jgi:hypothetical protein
MLSAEGSFCENAESPSSNTWTDILYCKSANLTIDQDRIRDQSYQPRMNLENLSNRGPRSASLELTLNLFGHQTTTAGALVPNTLWTLLHDGLGNGSTAGSGTTLSAATSATSFTFTSTSGWAAGMLARMGSKGDGKGDGQAFVIGTVGSPVTTITALPATPANGDVVYGMPIAYHDESSSSSLTTYRFAVMHATTGAQYHLMGGQLAGVKLNIQPGVIPEITLSYKFAYWQRQSTTFPNTSITPTANYSAPSTGGSFFIQDWASGSPTSTRNTESVGSVEIALDMGLEPVNSPGGNGTYQIITAWQRTKAQPTITFQLPWKTAYETWWDTSNTATDPPYKHILYTLNTVDGRAVLIYMPRVFPIGNRPSGVVEMNKQNYVKVMGLGTESTVTTNEVTRSAIRIGLG